ncbi:hypothetical protein EVA_06982 [gut metagenome]|uniref:Uncharacterized protein n=1 Tax=gut metagenome TaxID=749906 RepID=J9GC45_9ZZZZ
MPSVTVSSSIMCFMKWMRWGLSALTTKRHFIFRLRLLSMRTIRKSTSLSG